MYKNKIESLEKEYNATVDHANAVYEEYVKFVVLQTAIDMFENLDDFGKVLFIKATVDGTLPALMASITDAILGINNDNNNDESDEKSDEEDEVNKLKAMSLINFLKTLQEK
jgi:hypothetical protein